MRIAVLSDAHGNLEATRAVLDHIDERLKPDEIWFLGDAVGYGPDPTQVLHLLWKRSDIFIRGNHDSALFDPDSLDDLNPRARAALEWTMGAVSDEDVDLLRKTPNHKIYDELDLLLSHGSPHEPEKWHYVFTPRDAETALSAVSQRIILLGHSHLPLCFAKKRNLAGKVLGTGVQKLDPKARLILNPGSVGQPRDGDNRASFGLLDTEAKSFSVIRVEYDIKATADKIARAGLPLYLAERLFVGL